MLVPLHKSITQKALTGSKICLVMYVEVHNCRENSTQVLILSSYFFVLEEKIFKMGHNSCCLHCSHMSTC